jgi:hypothetical protein
MTTSDALAGRVQAIEGERASLQTLDRDRHRLLLPCSCRLGRRSEPVLADGNAGSMATSS